MNRTFRALGVVALALVGLAAGLPAKAESDIWRISLQYPDTDLMVGQIRNFAKKLEERSKGEIKSEIFTNFTLFKQGAELPAMQRGNLDIAVLNTGDIEQQITEYTIFSSGYLFRDHDHFRKVFDGEIGQEFADEVLKRLDVKVLGVLYGGTRQMTLRQPRKVEGPADLNGVKLRMPGAPAWLTLGKGLGVTPTPMALGEVYLSLRTGAIDGQENPLPISRSLKLEEVIKQIVLTSHMVQPVVFVLAKSTWEKLTPEQQQIVTEAAKETVAEQDATRLAQEKDDRAYFESKNIEISSPDLEAFRASVKAALDSSGLPAKWPQGLADRIAAVK